ncbi:MAG: ABC transporter ATP-binding protein [Spirochaetales bacterium]|nr:ABC transporter ATP-binding protein [Spirochaetales bacterium]
MLNYIQRRLALSKKGAKDFVKGTFWTTILNIAIMFTAFYTFIFLKEYIPSIFAPDIAPAKGAGYFALLALALLVVSWIIAVIQYRSTFSTIYDESANRRLNLAEKLRKLPLAFFGEKNLSDLTSTIMADSTDLEHTFSHAVPQLFASIIGVILIAIGMISYNWQLGLALFWVVPVATLILVISKKKQGRGNKNIYEKKREVTQEIQEGLETIQEIKSYNNEAKYMAGLSKKLDDYEKNLIKGELLTGVFVNGAQSVLKLGLATVIIAGASLYAAGKVDLFTYLIFLVLGAKVFDPVNEVFNNLAALFYLDIRINRVREMENLPIQSGTTEFNPTNYNIEFRNVIFSYDNDNQVIQGINFVANQGEVTALVGPSGGGKTTAAKLAARFWDIDSGEILIGGQDISKIDPETLLKHFSVVFQDVTLFNASILDNIRIGRQDATDHQVIEAAKLAQCDEFVSQLHDGYKTIIGENGDTLSGGERQRISIARALLKDAPIILLDEATASLDVENETKIQRGISELIRNKTVLVIAHRMRTVSNADQVVVLKDGKIVESGRPQELRSRDGVFAKMVNRQLAEVI